MDRLESRSIFFLSLQKATIAAGVETREVSELGRDLFGSRAASPPCQHGERVMDVVRRHEGGSG